MVLPVARPALGQNAQPVAQFDLTFPGIGLRPAPSVMSKRGLALAQGAKYPVLARTRDNSWIQVTDGNISGWISAGFGTLSGEVAKVPVAAQPLAGYGANSNRSKLPDWIVVPANGRRLLAQAYAAGRDGRMFTIAGDSNSAWPRNLGRVVSGVIDPAKERALTPIVARYDGAFGRMSVAVGGGYRAADMFLPEKAHPSCQPGEPMFPCELRMSRASIVFIQLGTGDKFVWQDYEANLRRMIEYAISQSVLPVLVTKADELESLQGGAPINHINETIRKLAGEYQLPMIDFFAATRPLPVIPNPELPKRPFTQYGLQDEWGYYFHLTEVGFDLRVRSTLLMLDALTR